MSGYSSCWRATIFASTAFHFFAALGFSYVLPNLMPEPKIADVAEFEWVDVDLLPPDVKIIEAIPTDAAQENLPTFNAQDLFVPELTIPEVKIEPPPQLEIKPLEPPKPQPPPQVAKPEQKIEQPEQKEEPPKEVVVPANQKLGRPPVAIMEVYPEKGSGLGYRGIVSVVVTISKEGKVQSANVVQSSGRMFVDEIACKAAMHWTFKPALDQKGKPMVCDKIIIFDFKKFSEA